MKLNCVICNNEFTRSGKQAKIGKCCSFKCLSIYNKGKDNCSCDQCGTTFHRKKSRIDKQSNNFCSRSCFATWKSINLRGCKNPNFRNCEIEDGYKIYRGEKFGRIKQHHAVIFEVLEINKLPNNYCVHHRDCDPMNNCPDNLVLITNSDHRWLHKQYGSATLWAYLNGKINLEDLVKWSDNKEKSQKLLPMNVLIQKESGIFKQGEFEENPEVDNIELSQIEHSLSEKCNA